MTAHTTGADPWLAMLFAPAGLAFGWVYFAALRRGVASCMSEGALGRCAGGLLARLAAAALFFACAVHWGVWPLLAAFLGFLGARQLALRAAGRAR